VFVADGRNVHRLRSVRRSPHCALVLLLRRARVATAAARRPAAQVLSSLVRFELKCLLNFSLVLIQGTGNMKFNQEDPAGACTRRRRGAAPRHAAIDHGFGGAAISLSQRRSSLN